MGSSNGSTVNPRAVTARSRPSSRSRRSGSEVEVERRLIDKLAQAAAGNSNLPAMAGVVGFRARLIVLADLESRQA